MKSIEKKILKKKAPKFSKNRKILARREKQNTKKKSVASLVQ